MLNATFVEALASPSEASDGELVYDDDTELEDNVDAGVLSDRPGTDDPAATDIQLDKVTDTPHGGEAGFIITDTRRIP